ncbi:hypothetical protein [Paraburkholderia elongata]|uniref:Uncharacterized protein n=1 Tax=Paraburkholderia elongata TaxID=2675747 RepID=A0A972NJ87_9BURK|nr:hypothetical protein [Paraburkholderia elongata]NPT54423.1 hypothetical protein [Paraburkholderia elongata]
MSNASRIQLSPVEKALYYAVRLLARMDSYAGHGNAFLAPEVSVWMLEQIKPSLMKPLHEVGKIGELIRLLHHYNSLRETAEEMRHRDFYENSPTDEIDDDFLTLHAVARALARGIWKCDDNTASKSIKLVMHDWTLRHQDEQTPWEPPMRWVDVLAKFAPGTHLPRVLKADLETSDAIDTRLTPVLSTALTHARQQLLACDSSGYHAFWNKVYNFALGEWLTVDLPEVAAQILANKSSGLYFDSIGAYVLQMRVAERFWRGLTAPVRALLLGMNDEPEALRLIGVNVRAGGIQESEAVACATRIWKMLKRRATAGDELASELAYSNEPNAVVESIRADQNSNTNFYLIDIDALPHSLRHLTDERYCLVVRLPEQWLGAKNALATQSGVHCFAVPNDRKLSLSIGCAFVCNFDKLWPDLFRFRRSIPVLHVFENQCILAFHQFNHFADLRELNRQVATRGFRHAMSKHEHPGSDVLLDEDSTTNLANASRPVPAFFDNFVDFSTPLDKSLSEAYLAENPGTR